MASDGLIRRYWDSFCFIALLNDDEGAEDCEKILEDAKEEKIQIIVSPLVQVEVVRPRGSSVPIPREAEEKIRAFLENDYIKWRIIDREIADLAQSLCWKYSGVHPRDAIHLAVALDTKCHMLETMDKRLLGLNGKMENSDLQIIKPKWTGQLGLFKKTED